MTRAFYHGPALLLFVLALSAPGPSFAGNAPPDDIKRAAGEGIVVFLKDKRMGNLQRLGFQSRAEIDNAALGEGFQIFTIPPDKLLNDSLPQDLPSLVIPTNQWQFLIVSGDKANALLTVDIVDGAWTPVSIGSSGLAQQLAALLAAWPASAGYEYRLIRVYQAKSDFIELSHRGKVVGIVPLTSLLVATSGEAGAAYAPRSLHDPKEVLSELRPVVRRNLQLDGQIGH
jgi:hypothetical protein